MSTYGGTYERDHITSNEPPAAVPVPETVRSQPKLLTLFGGISILLGVCALVFPFVAALATNVVIGAVMVSAGLVSSVHAVKLRGARGWGLELAGGLIALGAGALLLFFPLQGILSLSFLLVAFFITQGTLRTVTAIQHRDREGWGWLLATAVLELLLGVVVLLGFPGAAIWLLGALLGVDLLFTGIGMVVFASVTRKSQTRRAPARV